MFVQMEIILFELSMNSFYIANIKKPYVGYPLSVFGNFNGELHFLSH
jgi:hypothetical protein